MNIETKFDIGDKVYTIYKNRIEPCYIIAIDIQVDITFEGAGYTISELYTIKGIKDSSYRASVTESLLHSTPEDLLESLKNELD